MRFDSRPSSRARFHIFAIPTRKNDSVHAPIVVAFEHRREDSNAEEKRKKRNGSRQKENGRREESYHSHRRIWTVKQMGVSAWEWEKCIFSEIIPWLARFLSARPPFIPHPSRDAGATPFPPLRRPRAKKVSANLTLAVPFIRLDKSSQRRNAAAAAVEEKIFTAIGSAKRRCVR
jgi:hypothetical protein